MLFARNAFVAIDALNGVDTVLCKVVFNYVEGNLKHFNRHTWDEYPCADLYEIMDVFPLDNLKCSVVNLLTEAEEEYLKDVLAAMLEDEKCSM